MRVFAAALLSMLLVSAVAGILLVDLARSNPLFRVPIPQIYIESPTSSVYNSNSLTLTFRSNGYYKFLDYSNVKYSDNWEVLGTVDEFESSNRYSFALTNLAEGEHTVSVTATVTRSDFSVWYAVTEWVGPVHIKDAVTFTVDTVGPHLVFWTPQNKSFGTDTVTINFTAEEPLNTLSYSLDGQGRLSLNDNNLVMCHIYGRDNYQITLGNLGEGSHSLKVYAKDGVGNIGESEMLQFTVGQDMYPLQTGESESYLQLSKPFPTLWVSAALIASAAAVSFGLVAYFLRRKKRRSTS
jgi:hypothetical protein